MFILLNLERRAKGTKIEEKVRLKASKWVGGQVKTRGCGINGYLNTAIVLRACVIQLDLGTL